MTRLFAAIGVDYGQWRALMRAYTLVDWSVLLGAYGFAAARRAAWDLLFMAVGTGLLGAMIAVPVWLSRDTLLAALVFTLSIVVLSGTFAIFQTTSLLRPEDYAIVGFRPVSARTYFFAKVSGIVTHVLMTSVLVSYVPVLAFVIRPNGSWQLGLGAAFAALMASCATMFAAVAAHGWAVRALSAMRLERFVGYLHHLAGITIMVMLFAGIGQVVDALEPTGTWVRDLAIPREWWVLLVPPAWFASYIEISRGSFGWFESTAVAVSLLATAVAGGMMLRQLSAGYNMMAAEPVVDLPPHANTSRQRWPFLAGEARAVALVAGSTLRGDLAFQSNLVMSLLLMGGVTLIAPFAERPIDPFIDVSSSDTGFLFLATFLPPSLFGALVTSSRYQASWIFFATPSDRAKLIAATRDAVAFTILLPTVLLIVLIFSFTYGHFGHALLHAAPIGMLGYIALQLKAALPPRVPFSVPILEKRSPFKFDFTFLFLLIAMPAYLTFRLFGYQNIATAVTGVLALIALSVVVNRWSQKRLERAPAWPVWPGC